MPQPDFFKNFVGRFMVRRYHLYDEIETSGRQRPYRDEHTGSLPNSEVNRRRARSVLGWGTAWEALWVLLAF